MAKQEERKQQRLMFAYEYLKIFLCFQINEVGEYKMGNKWVHYQDLPDLALSMAENLIARNEYESFTKWEID
tara:strand:- start:283 stop:498 length:216 start_codon:yes stop_codon:yes gene_type:complete